MTARLRVVLQRRHAECRANAGTRSKTRQGRFDVSIFEVPVLPGHSDLLRTQRHAYLALNDPSRKAVGLINQSTYKRQLALCET